MSTSAPTVPEPETSPRLSEPQRLLNTFIVPSKTFVDVKRKPSWWVPWLIVALLSLTFAYLVDRKVGYDQVVDTALKLTPKRAEQLDRLQPEQRQRQMALAVKITKGLVYASPVSLLLVGVIIAAVLMGTVNFVSGAEIGLKSSLAVLFYSWVPPSVVKTLITIASMLAPGFAPEGFNIENPVATNLAAFMSFPPSSPALYKLASAVDVLTIWIIILLGMGFSSTAKVKRSTATLIVTGWYLVAVLLGAAWAALGA